MGDITNQGEEKSEEPLTVRFVRVIQIVGLERNEPCTRGHSESLD